MTRRANVAYVVVAIAALASSCTSPNSAGPTTPVSTTIASAGPTAGGGSRDSALVTRVVDGDTVEARFGARPLIVRLIGIDTPESVAPDQPVQCFALQASAYTTERLEGARVRLQFDLERIDPFGRTLAYVWLGDELFNETLVREGYAFVTTYPPNVRYVDRFRAAQREARSAGRGVWGRCVQQGACDPNYPDACIPPPPPDLDCSDIDERRFTVLPPDPHNLDGDHNGIGCEEP